ncbi:hypothetical protein GJ689_07780 [Rhodoplanes serenus]|uniref:MerR family transcriptional regulator n=1 Tax=Rhodoplanes serenus TaxID=200615 RepID=A0A9X4XPE1_9BRAD|nr:hypothetical protein [Rhodoplanes serenus]MTW16106.1 hypothetical protein [Rhodoplanes serenus]
MSDLDEARYSLGQVARSVGLPESTLRSWFRRGHLGLDLGGRLREAHGHAHAVSLRTALWVGVIAGLVELQIPAARAAKVARAFVHFGEPDHQTGARRHPGELFSGHGVWTLLVVRPDDDHGVIIRADRKTPLANVFTGPSGRTVGAVVLWLNQIDMRVRTGLAHVEAPA